ncbi:RNA polymerase sigma factor sigA [Dorcoceras hygrometricum]|uniref:RNA polymerase sigma factor sigA n=1 Tax=Dorcoceras hygrometricum TaxID=472368 RepID=A0A2Z6ZYE8_9LAMI|nr:RNA polymerase sigma factor sigA [Dorcoceras hygrometricum]
MKIARSASPRTAATSAAHDAGCANQWRIVRPASSHNGAQQAARSSVLPLGLWRPVALPCLQRPAIVAHPAAQQLARSGAQPSSRDARQARTSRHLRAAGARNSPTSRATCAAIARPAHGEGRSHAPGSDQLHEETGTSRPDEISADGFSSSSWPEQIPAKQGGGITDSACKNQLVVVSVQYGPFNPYIPIRSTTIGKSRVAKDPIAMHTSWISNSDIASVTSIGYPRMSASGESSTTMHRILHASGSHPIPPPYDPNSWFDAFKESAVELAMETSRVDSVVLAFQEAGCIARWSWNEEVQQEATVGYQQMRSCARFGMSCDDISLDVITISRWISADEAKREKLKRRRVEIQQMA